MGEEGRAILNLVSPTSSNMDFNIGTALWFATRGRGRVLNQSIDPQELCGNEEGERKDGGCEVCGRDVKRGCNVGMCGICCISPNCPVHPKSPSLGDEKEEGGSSTQSTIPPFLPFLSQSSYLLVLGGELSPW